MLCCSIPAISFLQNIRTELLLHFMVHGIVLRNRKPVSLWCSCHLKTACLPENGKFLLMDFRDSPVADQPAEQNTVLADWPRAPMARCLFPMTITEPSGK